MAALNSAKIVRKVRSRLELSQEGLSRLMNSTKGAVQHWERGRNIPSLPRLLALRQLCPPSPERKELDALIREAQNGSPVTPINSLAAAGKVLSGTPSGNRQNGISRVSMLVIQRERDRLQRQVTKLETVLKRRDERVRILETLATDLQREMAQIRARQ